ncbi:MAG: aminotransferase class I/II-fold pyridoxal phosphate-dependent enzyme, partial [Patescibacteria group bacterium]
SVPDTAALIEATKMLEESDSLVKKLWKNTAYLKGQLQKTGFDTGSSETPITPVMVGAEELAGKFSEELLKKGVFATAIRFPMVPAGKARLRIMPSATHSKKDLDFGIKMLTQVARELSIL